MPPSCFGRFILTALLMLVLSTAGGRAQAPSVSTPVLPPGTIMVVGEGLPEGLPKGEKGVIVLPAADYRKLLDRIAELGRQANPDKPHIPSVCRLRQGRIETAGSQDVVRLQAVYEFVTTTPRATVLLGCRGAKASAASLDDKGTAPISYSATEGFSVTLDEPRAYKLSLDLELPLTARGGRGGEQGFDLDLPGAAITLLESFALPAKVSKVRVAGRVLPVELVAKPQRDGILLGPITKLDVSWDPPRDAAAVTAPPLLAAEGRINVQVDDLNVTTTARLTLKVLRGATTSWQLSLPPGADLTVEPAGRSGEPAAGERPMTAGSTLVVDGPPPQIIRPTEAKPIWTLKFEEPTSRDVQVEIVTRTARGSQPGAVARGPGPRQPDPRGPFPIGPFAVVGAFRQSGVIAIASAATLRVTYEPRGDLKREVPPADDPADALFRYTALPMTKTGEALPPLQLRVDRERGVVQVQLTHRLSRSDVGWRLLTEATIQPLRGDIEAIDLVVPPQLQGLQVDPTHVDGDPEALGDGRLRLRLIGGRKGRTFTVRLEGTFPMALAPIAEALDRPGPGYRRPPGTPAASAMLVLPRPLAPRDPQNQSVYTLLDQDGFVEVAVPDGFEVRGSVREWDRTQDAAAGTGRPLEPPTNDPSGRTGPLTFATARSVARVDLSWQPYRPDLISEATLDLLADDRQLQARLQLSLSGSPLPRQLALHASTPRGSGAREPMVHLRRDDGGPITAGRPGEWTLPLPPGEGPRTVAISWAVPLPSAETDEPISVAVPMIWPTTATRSTTRVRLWCSGSRQLGHLTGPWEMRPVGVVPGENRLPALVLAGTGIDLPLAIELLPHPGGPPVRAVLERALVQAGSGEAGQHAYRARFRLRDLDSTALDIDLPAPVGEAGLRAYASVSGQTVELTPIPIDETGRPTASSSGARAVRLVVPPGDPLILDLRYKLSVGRPGNASERGLAEWSFAPPVPRRVLPFGPVRWQIFLPPGLVPLEFTGRMASEVRWTWRSAGLVPIPAYTTAELDRWLATGEEPGAEPPPSGEPMLVARQASLAPLRLAVVPTNVWRLGCSLAVVLLGLGLAYAWTWRWGGWLAVGSATAGVIVVTFLWPQPAVQFVGAMQPGLLVLAVGLGFMAAVSSWGWWRTGRAMRGFSRSPMGSSLIRPASPARRREPSTVDAPRPANGGLPIET